MNPFFVLIESLAKKLLIYYLYLQNDRIYGSLVVGGWWLVVGGWWLVVGGWLRRVGLPTIGEF